MAQTPTTNEAFLREVDDELRRDRALRLWARWGRLAVITLVLALVAFGGWLWWRSHQAAAAGVEGERLSIALADLADGKPTAAKATLTPLATSAVNGYRAAARLALTDLKLTANDSTAAATDFAAIANDTTLAQPYRDLARVREVALRFDTLPPAQIIVLLKPLAVPGNPWFGSAGEMIAAAYLKANNVAAAGATLAALAKDPAVPASIRTRTAQLAGGIGVDVEPTGPKARN